MLHHSESERECSKVFYRVYRVPPELKPYIPIIRVGFALLLSTWEFPKTSRENVRNTKVALTAEELQQLGYLAKHARRSATEVIAAALLRAKASNVKPPRMR
jgi:hypothetical protein